MSSLVKERNYCLDFFKLVACIFIILRHISPLGDGWTAVATITRCFVPFFFMVAGYYCFRKDGSAKSMAPKILYIFKLAVIAYALYILVTFVAIYRYGEATNFSVNELPKAIFNLVLFNQPLFIPEFVWFLLALIYVYAIYALVQKFQDKIRISSFWLLIILIVSSALVLIEVSMTGRNFDMNITNTIQVVAIFLLAVKNPNFGKGVLANLGRDLSLYVYIIHIAIRRIVLAAYSVLGWESQIYFDIFPLVVMVGSLVAAFVLFRIFKFIGKRRKAEVK